MDTFFLIDEFNDRLDELNAQTFRMADLSPDESLELESEIITVTSAINALIEESKKREEVQELENSLNRHNLIAEGQGGDFDTLVSTLTDLISIAKRRATACHRYAVKVYRSMG